MLNCLTSPSLGSVVKKFVPFYQVCFNKAFAEKGLGVNMSVDYFGTILDIGIGKHRITNHFNAVGWPPTISVSQREDVVSTLHKRKTDLFIMLLES